eukprot:4006899-Lingulodinium_polyedra.AAC.1
MFDPARLWSAGGRGLRLNPCPTDVQHPSAFTPAPRTPPNLVVSPDWPASRRACLASNSRFKRSAVVDQAEPRQRWSAAGPRAGP